ncbi:hypothetical protein COO60DRAFT_500873 [Scenedesmus sp. NREL 46B-D3]|nr:hypothetical protein COO60DRAFT_500873 [Scenedesmus sp. NREL 46B-D3]
MDRGHTTRLQWIKHSACLLHIQCSFAYGCKGCQKTPTTMQALLFGELVSSALPRYADASNAHAALTQKYSQLTSMCRSAKWLQLTAHKLSSPGQPAEPAAAPKHCAARKKPHGHYTAHRNVLSHATAPAGYMQIVPYRRRPTITGKRQWNLNVHVPGCSHRQRQVAGGTPADDNHRHAKVWHSCYLAWVVSNRSTEN